MNVLHLELEVLGAAGLDDVAVIQDFLGVLSGIIAARAEGRHPVASDGSIAFIQHMINLNRADLEGDTA